MKILIDTSSLDIGGGVQVGISFLKDLADLQPDDEYIIVQSAGFRKAMQGFRWPSNFIIHSLSDESQHKISLRIKEMKRLENEIQPDVIFMVFGPSYYKSASPKVVGFAIPHIIYSKSPFFEMIPIKQRIRFRALSWMKTLAFKKNSDALIFETEHARTVFIKKAQYRKPTFVQSNTLNSIFYHAKNWKSLSKLKEVEARILLMASPHVHKNFVILPAIIDILKNKFGWRDFSFLLTLSRDEARLSDKYDNYIEYVGKVPLESVPDLYTNSDIVLMPSLLEVFSATYLEAMFMKKPLVVSDMGFARDICAGSALYCDPVNAVNYAVALNTLRDDPKLRIELTEKGTENLKRFGNSMQRTLHYIEIIKKTANGYKK